MKTEIPINFEEDIKNSEKINYCGNNIIEKEKKFTTIYLVLILIISIILSLIIWVNLGKTELDKLVSKMSEINWRIENRDILITKLVNDNKKDKVEYELVQKDFILKTNARILNNWKTSTWVTK